MTQARIPLFWPQHVEPESQTFQIPHGMQLTVVAVGLQEGDEVTFQIVHVPTIDLDDCACVPSIAVMPSVAAYTDLMCCGEKITLTVDNPHIILDSPQRMLMRAVLVAEEPDSVFVWALETNTPNVTDRLRGCACGD